MLLIYSNGMKPPLGARYPHIALQGVLEQLTSSFVVNFRQNG